MAGYFRVGMAQMARNPRHPGIELTFGLNDVWGNHKGWREQAFSMLAGKRQIGSQRFSILDELRALDAGLVSGQE